MSDHQEQEVSNEISIEDLEESLEVYEIESDQKLVKLKHLFDQKKTLDLRQVFYEERSSIEVKFQNILGDLNEFLINQQVPSTEKLRKTFYRILESPLLLLFKVSRFEIFNLRLNAFDIELEPIEAIRELATLLYKNIDEYVSQQNKYTTDSTGLVYDSYDQFLSQAKINLISDEIFILYSYLRKGSNILKKKVEDKIKVIEIFNTIEEKLISTLITSHDIKTLKELSILNYQIYLLENNFDAICFYLKIPFHSIFKDVFKELQILAEKAKLTSNYDMFVYIFIKFNHQILEKLKTEGIDEVFQGYIQNGLITLLQLWGCRICHFKEFFNLFKGLCNAYPDRKKVLEICLKHVPNLSKEDIALIRANYRQHIENKRNEFLSLMKPQSLQQINSQLNSLYHQILYNLDFSSYKKQQIVELLTLVNGNSSIEQFFMTTEKAFKEWNHTIDFNNHHKFIESQFKLTLNHSQTFQSLRLFTNLCILQEKGFNKEFQTLVAKGTINKILIGMLKFLLSSQKPQQLLKENDIILVFIAWSFKFLQKTLPSNSKQWQQILYPLAGMIKSLPSSEKKQNLQQQLTSYIVKNIQNFHLGKCISIFKRIIEINNQQNQLINLVIDLFMKDTMTKSNQIQKFRFFGKQVKNINNQQLTNDEADFLKKYAHIQNGYIEVKQPSCLKLSQLQVITNPIHFQKAMDSYYFSLDSNSKRFIQYIAEECQNQTQTENSFEYYSTLIHNLIIKYPLCLPILCNVRIGVNTQNSNQKQQFRFVESLVNKLNSTNNQKLKIKQILVEIMKTDQIKYRNGRDYVVEQIVPMILKRTLTLINSSSKQSKQSSTPIIELYEILSFSLNCMKLSELKIDTIQKSIQKINQTITQSKCQKSITRLSACVYDCIRLFFKKKQIQIKRNGLTDTFENILWNQIRAYVPSSNSATVKQSEKNVINVNINDQIMVSPYTLSQEYNLNEYKIKKGQVLLDSLKHDSSSKPKKIKLHNILSVLPVNISSTNSLSSTNILDKASSNKAKQVDLTLMEYDIEYHLGKDNLELIENKQNLEIRNKFMNKDDKSVNKLENNEKSVTFVQYYLRELAYPEISNDIVLKTISAYLKNQIQLSYLWTNPKNLEKIFVPFVMLYDYLTMQNSNKTSVIEQLKKTNQNWAQLLQYSNSNILQVAKQILKAFSLFGYNNLYGQNYKSLNIYSDIKKSLHLKQIQEQSFLSIILKRSLQFPKISQIKDELNLFLDKLFTTRPNEQTSLMYKVGIDKNLLNLIMRSLEIENLNNISFLFHSNFNNLRLYTDQLHEGLKALNMASKTRSFNEYIQLAKQIDDEQFLAPMKLFQENFRFFIKIQKQGYNFKKSEQQKLTIERLINLIRNYQPQNKQTICKQCDKIILQYLDEVEKLELNIANRVKSFYLVTKLRDLSYQNSISISLIREILKFKKVASNDIMEEIKKVQIFSLLLTLYKELVLFGKSWQNEQNYQNYHKIDHKTLSKQITFCTTERYSHSMDKIYEKCDLQLDQIIQRCLNELKLFFSTEQGHSYIQQNHHLLYPPFLIKSFIESNQIKSDFINKLRKGLESGNQDIKAHSIALTSKNSMFTDFVSQTRALNKKIFLKKDSLKVIYEGKTLKLQEFLPLIITHMTTNETLILTKSKQSKFLTFNKYKTSEPTLQQIETLGYIIGYIIYHKLTLNNILPLHSSIISILNFNIADIDDVLDVDFKIWEDIKRILSVDDSKTLNLNFSYIFQNIKTLEQERIELVDKGASKKVNNMNRVEFCDAIACYVLYKNLNVQISRFLEALLSIVPKKYLSSLSISEIYSLFYNKDNLDSVMKKYMKKIGIVTPQVILKNGERIQNLKDYQNIQWAVEFLFENETFRSKIWKNQTNLFIVTTIGGKGNVQMIDGVMLIQHFQSKAEMLEMFKKL